MQVKEMLEKKQFYCAFSVWYQEEGLGPNMLGN